MLWSRKDGSLLFMIMGVGLYFRADTLVGPCFSRTWVSVIPLYLQDGWGNGIWKDQGNLLSEQHQDAAGIG